MSPAELKQAKLVEELKRRYPPSCVLHREGSQLARCYVDPTGDHIILDGAALGYWADSLVQMAARSSAHEAAR